MASVNKVILVGNLGADPETRYLPSGDAVSNIRLATTDRYKDKASGDMKELTEWHRVAFFGRLAEIAGEYLKKGSSVYIEGRIRSRQWEDQEKNKRTSYEIIAFQMTMLGSKSDSERSSMPGSDRPAASEARAAAASASTASEPPAEPPTPPSSEITDEDIPF